MSGNDRYVTVFSLFSALGGVPGLPGHGCEGGQGTGAVPWWPTVISGTPDPGPQGGVCSEVRNRVL